MRISPAPEDPSSWRAAARRLIARLRPGRGAGIGATEAAAFDAAARQAYQAALKLDREMPPAPAPRDARPAEAPTRVPDLPSAPVTTETASLLNPPPERLVVSLGESPEQTPAVPHPRQPGETPPDPLLRTPSSVAPVADDFFDSLVRRVESDR